jgi:hypothetical protein
MSIRSFPCPVCSHPIATDSKICPKCEHRIGFLESMRVWTKVIGTGGHNTSGSRDNPTAKACDKGDLEKSAGTIPLTIAVPLLAAAFAGAIYFLAVVAK